MPDADEMKKYWDQHPIGAEPFGAELGSPEFYDAYIADYDDFYDYKLRVFRYEQYGGRKVLEIGCGLGIDSVKFAKSGAELTCIDLSDTSVRCTRRLIDHMGLRADVRAGNAEHLEFPDKTFDVVYAYGVLMHVGDEEKATAEVRRVLKPGGVALVVLYHRRSWFWALSRLSGTNIESEADDPPINRVHTLAEARHLFRNFPHVAIELERFPKRTRRRKGISAYLFNNLIVPTANALPRALIRPFGWHILIRATR